MKIVIWFISLMLCGNAIASDLTIGSTITSPISGCNLTNSELVKITVINAATSTYSGTFNVSYKLNNNPTITESVTVVVLPVGGTYIYEFSTLLDMSGCGIQTLTLSVFDINDVVSTNDTIVANITNDCSPIQGTFTGPASVCETGNSGQISLTGNTGVITNWAYSDDLGSTLTSTGNSTNIQSYSNISVDRLYRVYFDSQHGLCPSDSVDFGISVDAASIAGVLSSDSSHCDTIMPTTLYLTGYNGTVSHYRLSLNGGTSFTTFTNPFDTLQYTELSNSFQFFAITQNASCPADSSNTVNISILNGPEAGEIVGEDTLCAGVDNANLDLINFDGTILDWEYTLDAGATWNSTGETTSSILLSGITGNSQIRAIVEKAPCGTDTAFFNIVIGLGSVAGTVTGDAIYCGVTNNGAISTTGFNGSILGWISTNDGGNTFNSLPLTTDTIDYNNLISSTNFAVIVQFEVCPPDTSNFASISIYTPSFAGQISTIADTLCSSTEEIELVLNNNTGSVVDWEYSTDSGTTWNSMGIVDSTINYANTAGKTLFRVIVQNETCAPDTASASIYIHEPLSSFALEDTIYLGDSVQLNGGMGETYLWSPNIYINNILIVDPKVAPIINTVYQVTVTDSNGCAITSTHSIIIIENPNEITINNFITPNGDGYNDTWLIENIELFPNNSVMVFDVYGQIVFEATSYKNDWDMSSDNLPDGTYLYIVKTQPDKSPVKGTMTIVNSK